MTKKYFCLLASTRVCIGLFLSLLLICAGSRGAQVVTWGNHGTDPIPANVTNVVAIGIMGYSHVALRADGTVAVWSNGGVDPGVSNVTAIFTGWSHGFGLQTNGTIVGWADDQPGDYITGFPADLTNAAALVAGSYFSFGIRPDGSVVGWGDDTGNLIDVAELLSNVVAIASLDDSLVALRADGTVFEWDGYGDPTNSHPELTNIIAVAHNGYSIAALRSDGSVVTSPEIAPDGLTNITAIAGGSGDFLALRKDGTVVAWGCDCRGATNVPAGLTNVTAIAMGGDDGETLCEVLLGGTNPPAPTLNVSRSNGVPSLGLSGAIHRRYVLEESADVIHWNFKQNVLMSSSSQSVMNLPSGGAGARFYRARLLP